MSVYVTSHVRRNERSVLLTEELAKWTPMEQGNVRIKWAYGVKYIPGAEAQPLMVMLLYQSHAGGLVRLFSEMLSISQPPICYDLPHDKHLVSQTEHWQEEIVGK